MSHDDARSMLFVSHSQQIEFEKAVCKLRDRYSAKQISVPNHFAKVNGVKELVTMADENLYKAKRAGRNRICIAEA